MEVCTICSYMSGFFHSAGCLCDLSMWLCISMLCSFISHCINIYSTVDGHLGCLKPVLLTTKAMSKINIILRLIDFVWILLTKAGRVARAD